MELTAFLSKLTSLRLVTDEIKEQVSEIGKLSTADKDYLEMELSYISYRIGELEDFAPESKEGEIHRYLCTHIEDYKARVEHADTIMQNLRCDLAVADSELYCEIIDKVHDWAELNGYDANDWNEETINPDDIICYR